MWKRVMPITVELPEALARHSGGNKEISASGTTVAEALENLWQSHPDLRSRVVDKSGRIYPYLVVFHNGRRLAPEEAPATELADGDRLEIMTLAGGG